MARNTNKSLIQLLNRLTSCGHQVISRLESSANLVIDWFWYNYNKFNESKCHLLVSELKEEVAITKIGNSSRKIAGVTIDRKLKFIKHVQYIYSKAGKKCSHKTVQYLIFQ